METKNRFFCKNIITFCVGLKSTNVVQVTYGKTGQHLNKTNFIEALICVEELGGYTQQDLSFNLAFVAEKGL